MLPDSITPANPLNLQDNATPERYLAAVSALLDSHDFDALMIIHAPGAAAPATETARLLIDRLRQHPRATQVTLLTNWCGEHSSQQARRACSRSAHSHLPHAGGASQCLYAYGRVPPQPATAAGNARAAPLADSGYRSGPPVDRHRRWQRATTHLILTKWPAYYRLMA